MKTMSKVSSLVLSAALALGTQAFSQEAGSQDTSVRRFALLVGANYGGLDRVRLQYAESDTRSVAQVLTKLGGVDPGDRLLITEPRPNDLKKAFRRMSRMIAGAEKSGARAEFIFYYSGHSDESGLLLGGKRFSYPQIRSAIKELPADVRIAILDSCASGAFTRTKGGTRVKPFLVDTSTKVKGYAVLTSSSATEAAQESDRVGGSFFTHSLVSGLRGAADINRDRTVTLAEAYQYAFNETLARTEATKTGPQHPNYDFQLAGSGDLVLTDLRGTSALLEIGAEVTGRLFVRDAQGRLVVELNKPANQAMSIGLDPGEYRITVETPREFRRGTIEIKEGQPTKLVLAELDVIETESTVARGGLEVSKEVRYLKRFASFSVVPGLDTNPGNDPPVHNNFSLNLLAGYGGSLTGFELSGIGAWRSGPVKGLQLAGICNVAESFKGVEIAGISNIYSKGPSTGLSLSGVIDISAGKITGLQLSGTTSIAQSIAGAQIGVASITWDDVTGLQLGVFSHAFDLAGVQIGVASVASGEVRGWQTGVANVTAGDFTGVQTGVANVTAGEFKGAQIGILNWATRSKGLMLGIVNIAAEGNESIPVGLLNIIADGTYQPTAWISDTSLTNVALKMGSRKFYSILGASIHPGGDYEGISILAGFGGHVELSEPLWMDIDVITQHLYKDYKFTGDGTDFLNKLRTTVGWQIADHFSIYAGLSLNFLVSNRREHAGPAWLRLWHKKTDDYNLDLGLGLIFGVQI